jgi:hypothetical protein
MSALLKLSNLVVSSSSYELAYEVCSESSRNLSIIQQCISHVRYCLSDLET